MPIDDSLDLPDSPAHRSKEAARLSAQVVAAIRGRIARGYYDRPGVIDILARRILQHGVLTSR